MNKINHIAAAVMATACLAAAPVAAQEAYPVDTVTVIVPYAAGGAADLVGRIVADELSRRFTANFIVENVGGASGTIGAERAARAKADGSTLLLAGNAILTVAPHLGSLGFDPLEDLVAIANVSEAPRMLAATKTLPEITDFASFVALAKELPGQLNYGSVGVGSTGHIAIVDMLNTIDVGANHIPYSGATEVVQAVLSGDVHFMLEASTIAQVRQGTMTPLAVPGTSRMAEFPDVPTFAELGHPTIRGVGLQMIMAPKGTPAEVIASVENALKLASEDAAFNEKLARADLAPRFVPAAETDAFIAAEFAHYDALLTTMGLK
jgi:tripartite-type tricarboxylate transporter receptor subunit TctC